MKDFSVFRREIWLVDLGSHEGTSIQESVRPVLILSNRLNNIYSKIYSGVPLTTRDKARHLPVHIPIKRKDTDYTLEEDSIALVEQRCPIAKEKMIRKIGMLTNDEVLDRILEADRLQVSE